jgi:dipeptidyl-peptidase-4
MQRLALLVMTFASTMHAAPDLLPKTPLDASYLRDHAQTRGFMLGRPSKAQPTPDGNAVLFLRSGPRSAKQALFEFDVATGKTREWLTPETLLKGAEENLTPEEKARRERMRVSVGGFANFQLSDDGRLILVSLSGKLYVVSRSDGKVRELGAGPGVLDPRFSPDSSKLSYVRDHDVFVFDLKADRELRLTKGGSSAKSNGLAEFVAQEEMGRFVGTWWAPDSKSLLVQQTDNTKVETWFVADPISPGATPAPFFYPRPGKDNARVSLSIMDLEGTPTRVDWDRARYPYLASARWAKNGPLTLTVQTRLQDEVAVLQVDPATGDIETLWTEKDEAWVNLRQDVPHFVAEHGLLWVSETNGGPQLELRASDKKPQTLVPAKYGFQSLVHVDRASKEIYFLASSDPTESHLHRIKLADGSIEKLTTEPGLHAATFTTNGSIYTLTSRLKTAMPRTTVHRSNGERIAELPSVAEDPPFLPRVEYLQVGDKNFHAAIVRPHDFDPKKKYPVMVDVYGGPHHVHVLAAANRWLLDQWYADQGFIVVAIDGRGTPGRGRDWERTIRQKFGSLPLEDQVAGLQALGKLEPAMDLDRVGIDGWSFGGYLSALAVLRRPDIFKVGVAGAPVCDWFDYDTHYTERYLGVPPKSEPAYKEGSLLTYAPDLRRPLLILHGTADDNVYFRHSLKLVDTLFRHGKDFEMVPLSGLTHMVPDPLVMERLHTRIAAFLKKNLQKTR